MSEKEATRYIRRKRVGSGLYGVSILIVMLLAAQTWAIRPPDDPNYYRRLSSRGKVSPLAGLDTTGGISQGLQDKRATIKALNNSTGWRKFIEKAGGRWFVRWNTATRTPHFATGRPVRPPIRGPLTKDNIEKVCRDFMSEHEDLLAAKQGQLRLVNRNKKAGRWHVLFEQTHNDIPVYGSRVYLGFTKDDRIAAFGSDVFADIDVNTVAIVGEQDATGVALFDCCPNGQSADRISRPTLCILPVRPDGKQTYILCWKLDILQRELQKRWQYFIDAQKGGIVIKRNILWYESASGQVEGEYKPEYASDPVAIEAFGYEEVTAEGPEIPMHFWDFNSDPGWTTEGDWAFGQPTGQGSGCGDPTSGYTGNNVYGYNLSGDYSGTTPVEYLTTTPFDCSSYENVRLRFMRWLGIGKAPYDSAAIEASNNGINWTTIWNHTKPAMCDGNWVDVAYSLSPVADLQPAVQLRWNMGPISGYYSYPGWNIDDVAIVSVQGGTNTTYTSTNGQFEIELPWQPATVVSELKGLYCDVDYAGGEDARFTQSDVLPSNTVNWTWTSGTYDIIDESNAYRHINFIHDYYKTIDEDFSGLDHPVPAAVYVDMSNAYWDGEGVAFGRGDGIDFDDFGLYAEVIYHEYTHGVTDKIYAGIEFPYFAESGAMNEGWSDYFGCALSISQSPLVGENGLVIYEPNGFRTLNNNYRRETDWFNEVHVDSQMFSSSLWQARQAVGPEAMDELVHFARYAHATTFEDYLLALLLEDDCRYGDGDLSNGTSHGQDIFTAFGNHGIGGLQYQASSIVVNEQTGNGDGKLDPGETAELSLTLSNGWADANNITATLECNDPLVTIHEANAAFDDANYGETTNNSADSFIISVADDCPDTHTINFTLTISADGPYRYSRTCLLYYNVAPRQLAYDDGAADESIGYGGAGGVLAVRVTPDTYPCYPTHVRLFPYTKTTTTVAVWDDDANGLPGTLLGTVTARPRILGDWYDVDISQLGLTIDSGSIYVGWIEGAFFLNGFDYDPPYYQRSWVSDGAEWNPLEYYGYLGNFMIRLRYSEEPPFHIKLPYDYALCPGQPVSFCLQAVNGTSPYDDWTALPQPDYNYSIAGSSSFAERGTGKGWQDDDASFAYDLPFEFQYYGTTYTKVYISTNGFLDFATDSSDYYNSDEELAYNVRIAPLWDDITTYSPGDIFIDESVPGEVAIRWQGETYMYELPVNFDVVLFNDGCIRFDYGFNDIGLSPTVGISAGDAFHYILVPGYNGDPNGLDNVASVLLTPTTPKPSLPADLTLDPATGCLSGTPLNEGEYLVIIEVNDSSSPPKTTKANFIFTIKPPIADFNRDCIVNFDDFASFGSNWLAKSCRASNNWCNGADLDQNKRVDIYDLAIFANLWLDGTTQ